MAGRLAGIRYAGGKSGLASSGTGRWIASLLPDDVGLYCEPFAGMLGVLLQREPAKYEVVNDLNSWIYRWWEGVRNYPEQLVDLLKATPVSRELFEKYYTILQSKSAHDYEQPEAAWITSIVLVQGLGAKMKGSIWLTSCNTSWRRMPQKIALLGERIQHIRLENRDALEVIEIYGKHEDALLYLDPPYRQGKQYYEHDVDVNAMFDLVKGLPCRVAISGYENCPWRELGWYEQTHNTFSCIASRNKTKYDVNDRRTEFLWTNFEPNLGQQPLFGV